jgi:hypothetical protein
MVGEMVLRPTVKVQLTHQNSTYEVMETLKRFADETRRHLDILMYGLAPPDDSGEEWLPMNVGSGPA